ncbi:hypothetical protein D3C78_1633940 [compost metagenome]
MRLEAKACSARCIIAAGMPMAVPLMNSITLSSTVSGRLSHWRNSGWIASISSAPRQPSSSPNHRPWRAVSPMLRVSPAPNWCDRIGFSALTMPISVT